MYKSAFKSYGDVKNKDEWFRMFKVLLFIYVMHLIYCFSYSYLNKILIIIT